MTTSTEQLDRNCRSIVRDLENLADGAATEFLDTALDIEFTSDRQGSFLGARLLVAYGGPNIWIDSRYDLVEGSWGQDQFQFSYDDVNGLHDACEDLFECLR